MLRPRYRRGAGQRARRRYSAVRAAVTTIETAPDDQREALALGPGEQVVVVERVRTAEGFERPAPPFSYGWAQIPDDASDQEALMAAADRRLYEAKARR